MASTINASSSGSGGLISTGDASGVLQLQSNGTVMLSATNSAVVLAGSTNSGGTTLFLTGVGTQAALGWGGNNGAAYPTTNFGGAIGNNFSNGGCEADIWNTYVGAPYSFDFYQKTGTSAASNLLRIMPNGALCLLSAGSVTSGTGIVFPGTQSASTDPNCLDDYEEGTFTPTITGYSGGFSAVTYSVQKGQYVKVGRLVTCQGYVNWSSKTGGSGVFSMAGLPFSTSDSNGTSVPNIQEYNGFTFSGRTDLGGEIFGSIVYFIASGSATTPMGVDVSNVSSSGYFYYSFSYVATA